MPFHNPYHFVPVKGGSGITSQSMSVAALQAGEVEHVTHDRFVTRTTQEAQPVYSGRLICRLITEDPVVVGATSEPLDDGSHRVHSFELEGKPALPASTLRGLIASVAETASNSALRILEDRQFSYRASMPGLSAIGMIVEVGGVLRLRPLALPTMQGTRDGAMHLDSHYHKMFPVDRIPPLKVYVGDHAQIRDESFVRGLPFASFSRAQPHHCYAKLFLRHWAADHTLLPGPCQYRKAGERGPEFLLSQTTTDSLPLRETIICGKRVASSLSKLVCRFTFISTSTTSAPEN